PSALAFALATKRASRATATDSAKPMPTNPPVATVSCERISCAASRAVLHLPLAGVAGCGAVWRIALDPDAQVRCPCPLLAGARRRGRRAFVLEALLGRPKGGADRRFLPQQRGEQR